MADASTRFSDGIIAANKAAAEQQHGKRRRDSDDGEAAAAKQHLSTPTSRATSSAATAVDIQGNKVTIDYGQKGTEIGEGLKNLMEVNFQTWQGKAKGKNVETAVKQLKQLGFDVEVINNK